MSKVITKIDILAALPGEKEYEKIMELSIGLGFPGMSTEEATSMSKEIKSEDFLMYMGKHICEMYPENVRQYITLALDTEIESDEPDESECRNDIDREWIRDGRMLDLNLTKKEEDK